MRDLAPPDFALSDLPRRGRSSDPALIVGGETLTYGELDADVDRAANRLRGLGLEPGDRVVSWMAKTRLACVLPLACARAGLVHVPANPLLKRAQVAHILADSGASLFVANRSRLQSLAPEDLAGARAVEHEAWDRLDEVEFRAERDPDRLAALLYTSGSTGRPKGVMLTDVNLTLGAVSVAHYLGLSPDDRTLCVLPLAFDYGQNQLLSTWAAGGCAIAFDYLLPRDVVRAVRRHDVTVLAGVPPLWLQLVEQDWSSGEGASLRTLTNSGGHLPLPTVRRLRQLFPEARLHLMYGLTEAFRSTSLDPALVDAHPDSVGTAVPFAEVLVVRPDGSEAAAEEEGELVHAGPLVGKGYWADPERSAERFRPAPSISTYGGTAVWSGDTVLRGTDGLIRFRGRRDAMIKVSGNRISPEEVEEAALASGAVSEALALGVPDERLGQAILLVAVPVGDDPETRLRAHFAAELPVFMQPREILFRESLPRTASGKLDRVAMARELA